MNYDDDVTLHVNGQNWLINKEKLQFTYRLVVLYETYQGFLMQHDHIMRL